MKERDYQLEHIEKIVDEVSAKRCILAQLPTGGGKTYEFCKIAQRFIRSTGKSVLILVHREELMYQAKDTIKRLLDIDAYLITAQTKKYYISRVYIGMVESTVSRLNMFDNVGLVIVDECHVANFNKIHNIFLEELIIGFSATPVSSSKKEPLNKYYKSIVTGPQIKTLISYGFLAQNITRCPKDVVDSTKFEIDKLKGDYNESKMAAEYQKPKHIENVVRQYFKWCKGKKTIIFNVNIEHSKQVTELFVQCGFNCRHLDSNSKDRKEILKWFADTEDAVLCNVGIATVGFDEPTIINVILNFSTLSIVKFIQTSGRGGRIIDQDFLDSKQKKYPYKLELKNYFNIIDMGGNCIRFGDWNDDRDWEYIFNNPDKPGNGIAPIKTCPSCEGLVHAAATICDLTLEDGSLCLHVFDRKKQKEEKELGEMILITKNINVEELIKKNEKKYDYYTFFEIGEKVVKSMYERYRNVSETILARSFEIYYEKCIEWYNKFFAGKNGEIQDITNSSWHIKRAKNNFDELVKKYKDAYENIDETICNVCGAETDIECEDCGFPVCENCLGPSPAPPYPPKEYNSCLKCCK